MSGCHQVEIAEWSVYSRHMGCDACLEGLLGLEWLNPTDMGNYRLLHQHTLEKFIFNNDQF
jgi:hypothetical protein